MAWAAAVMVMAVAAMCWAVVLISEVTELAALRANAAWAFAAMNPGAVSVKVVVMVKEVRFAL